MNKNLSKWIPWVVLAIVVVVALFFIDYDRVFKSDQTVEGQMEALSEEAGIDEIDDDTEFDIDIADDLEDNFID